MELWKSIDNYEGLYQVSTEGRVKSLARTIVRSDGQTKTIGEKLLKPSTAINGYQLVNLCRNGRQKTKKIHRLVAKAFIPNPMNKTEINHKDGHKNNNRVLNLEWVTPKENIRHALDTGLMGPKKRKNNELKK